MSFLGIGRESSSENSGPMSLCSFCDLLFPVIETTVYSLEVQEGDLANVGQVNPFLWL